MPIRELTAFELVQKPVMEAAGFVDATDEDRAIFCKPVNAGEDWKPKPVKIRLHHGAVVEVPHDVAIQRILQKQADLVTE